MRESPVMGLAAEKSAPKYAPCFDLEETLMDRYQGPVVGIDEAGRGPWAGPVVVAAVILNPARIPQGLNDSKL
ncbi:MAG TPA: ribonuclease HII, partial [Methyloceanibacter sp.]|nr:ribonuclease HII [Methyloceanibacter sp.]